MHLEATVKFVTSIYKQKWLQKEHFVVVLSQVQHDAMNKGQKVEVALEDQHWGKTDLKTVFVEKLCRYCGYIYIALELNLTF